MPFLQTIGGGSSKGFANRLALKYYTTTFNYTGSVQTFTIPAGTQNMTAHVFGPGGSATGDTSNTTGGAGGYTVGQINPVPGGSFKIIVGGGGKVGQQSNGCGGGYSAVATPNWAGSNISTDHGAIILAAGGGGGAGDHEVAQGFGGAGGGTTGQQGGYGGQARSGSGPGGGQSGGGSYPGQAGGGACSGGTSLCSGYELRGGQSCGNSPGVSSGNQGWPNQIYGGNWAAAAGGGGCNGGGGGAGYYGGSGAGHTTATNGNSGCGGGGSGYTGGSGSYTTSNVGTHGGNQHNVSSQATNSGYLTSGVNVGGVYNTDVGNGTHAGGNGKVVLYYLAPT